MMLSFALLNLAANMVFDSPEAKQASKHKISHAIYLCQLPGDEKEAGIAGETHAHTLVVCVVHLNVESC